MPLRKRNAFVEWFETKALVQIFSVLVAFVAWMIVNSGQDIVQRRTLKLEYVQMPKGLVFQKTPLKEAKVDLSGSIYQVRSVRDEALVYPIDLSEAKPGVNRFDLEVENIRLPSDIEASHLNPRSFNIYLEEIYSKTLPIKVNLEGKPADGFQVGRVKVTPETLSVSGPRSILSKLTEIPVSLSVEQKTISFSENKEPKLGFPGAEVSEGIFVEVEIGLLKQRQEFPAVPVNSGKLGGRVHITPQTAKVVLEGAPSDMRMMESRMEIIVPVEGLKRGRYRIRGALNLNDNSKIKIVSMEPESFFVEVLQEGRQR